MNSTLAASSGVRRASTAAASSCAEAVEPHAVRAIRVVCCGRGTAVVCAAARVHVAGADRVHGAAASPAVTRDVSWPRPDYGRPVSGSLSRSLS